MSFRIKISSFMQRYTTNGYAMIITSTVNFAFMALFLKLATARENIPVFEAIFFRSFINLAIILIFARLENIDLTGSNRRLLIMRSLYGFLALTCYFLAISKMNLADAVILSYTSPIFVSIFCVAFLKEKFSKSLIISIFFALVGAVLVLKPSFQFFNIGGLFGIMSGILTAVVYVTLGKLTVDNRSTIIIFYFTALSSVFSFPLALTDFIVPSRVGMVYLLLMGVFASIGQFAMTRGYKYLEGVAGVRHRPRSRQKGFKSHGGAGRTYPRGTSPYPYAGLFRARLWHDFSPFNWIRIRWVWRIRWKRRRIWRWRRVWWRWRWSKVIHSFFLFDGSKALLTFHIAWFQEEEG